MQYSGKGVIGLLVLSLCSSLVFSQPEKPVESKINAVTVFLNKAQLTREIKTRIEAGKTNLVLTGLTSQLDHESIQASGKGSFIIMGIAHRKNFLNELNTPKRMQVLKDSLSLIQNAISLENSQREILNKEEQMLLSNQKIGGTTQNLTAIELKAMADFYRSRLGEIVTTRMKIDERLRKLNERQTKIQRQIGEQNELFTRNTSEIVISLSAEAATPVELAVSYVVPNAGWYPVYDLRAIDTKKPVQLSYKANVVQTTGEEWTNVKLRLSTANPSLGGLKPELTAWYLDFYQPVYRNSDFKKQRLSATGAVHRGVPSEDDAEIAAEEGPAETTAEYVTTVQTTLNTEFEISLPYVIASTPKPTLVDIRNHELKADYIYSAAPKLDKDAFLMARATGWEEFSLLPGEANIFFEGTFVGKSFIDPNNIRDTLNISLGRDTRIVIKREKLRDFSSKKLIGTNRREQFAYEISVRNTKSEAVTLKLEDHIPVSRNSQIEVIVGEGDTGNAKYVAGTGKLSWDLQLQPNETKKVTYRFEVKYPKDRTLAGLD